jgi:hypothetical protein
MNGRYREAPWHSRTTEVGRSQCQRALRAITSPLRQSMCVCCSDPKALEKLAKKKCSVFYCFSSYRDGGLKRRKSQLYKPLTPNDIFGPVGADRQFNQSGLHLGRVRRLRNPADRKKFSGWVPRGCRQKSFPDFRPPPSFANSAGMQREAKGHFAGPGATPAALPGPPPTP